MKYKFTPSLRNTRNCNGCIFYINGRMNGCPKKDGDYYGWRLCITTKGRDNYIYHIITSIELSLPINVKTI